MKKFFVFSVLIHGMLGTVLFALYEPALKSETAQPIWITLVESENGLAPARVIPTTETVPPKTIPLTPAVFQEPATKTNSEMEQSPPSVLVEDHGGGGGQGHGTGEGTNVNTRRGQISNLSPSGNNFNIEETEFKVFLDEVRSRIDQAKRYPWLARLQGIEGRTQVRFRILPSGEPTEIEIVQSSQSRVLDQEATAMVKRVARFPQPPMASDFGVVVRLPLVFHLQGGSLVKE